MTKQKHRAVADLTAVWDSLDEDQKIEFINSDDITAVEIMRLDQSGKLSWSSLTH
jgi:hypothetical protein